jgi:uncharacterized membrane protein (DUF485 family)
MSDSPVPDATDSFVKRDRRAGLVLFLVYLVLYAGFVGLAAFAPATMASRPFGGVNLAVWYGMVLIVSPLALAAIYLLICRRGGGR